MKVSIERFDDIRSIEAIMAPLSEDKKKIMNECFKGSTVVWVGLIDNKVACIWGVALPTILSDRAYLWLWSSDVVKDHPFVFVRRAQIVIKELLGEYEYVVGVVDTSDSNAHNSVRWLKLLGAKFGEPSDGGLIPFQIRRP